MKAVVMPEHGGPEVLQLQEAERPAPQSGELLIRMAAAGVNPVDTQVRAGSWVPEEMGEPPMVLGWDVAGTVEDTGVATAGFEPGDRVFGMPSFPALARCDAEYVTAPARHVAHSPASLTNDQAGGLALAALTASQALRAAARGGGGARGPALAPARAGAA